MDTRSAGSGHCRACGGGRGCSRRLERRGWSASRGGSRSRRMGPRWHWLPVQVTEDLSVQVTEGLAVPDRGAGVLITCLCHRAAGSVAAGPGGSAPSGSAAAAGISAGASPAGGGPAGAARGNGPAGVVLRTAARPPAAWPGRRRPVRPPETPAAGRARLPYRQWPAHATPRMARLTLATGISLAPHHGAGAREQDWGAP
jgi:hypothetical protein